MMKAILRYTVFILIACPASLFAQDARFSQYFNNHLVLNPAFAGNGIEYIRVTAIYRNQWAGLGTPFTTQGFAIDKVVNRVGFGAAITRNGAGDASIKTLNIVGNLSYNLPLDADKINILSAGVQVGMINKSFDPSQLTFDNQYNPDAGYDPNMSSGEEFSSNSITRPDVNVGLSWQRGWLNKEIRFKPFLGIAYSHVTEPDETFIAEVTKLHAKSTIYGGAGFLVKENIELRPSVMLLNQGPHKEMTFGSLVNYQLDNKNSVQLGAYHRLDDAVIAYAGYQMNQLFVGMSYDVNTSELSQTGKGNNAFEISLTYSPRPRRKKETAEKKIEPVKQRAEEIDLMETLEVASANIEIPLTLEFNALEIPVKVVEVVEPEPLVVEEKVVVAVPDQEVMPEEKEVVVNQPEPKVELEFVPVPETPEIKDFDQDGVQDADDECPYIKGSVHAKGCPDSDNDGMIDMLDDCPMESGPITNKGCPDPNKPVTTAKQELVEKYDNILFATGSTNMTTDDIFDIIEKAIDIMYADKSTKVILSGHTDSEGDEYQNMILSQARANIVKNYMIKQGIDPLRIQTVAYGETMPLKNNDTYQGKKLNRRVEINILKK